ncbi:hypothetical protein FA13DRAFT_1688564 [Coprinellus micaceus]|uniref:Parvovirus non-structural protein 1 helicase domain-containing protein n=1 Tax=Coprinellus micaceus TaxID=71717 RepID=A0A4Y7TBI9_COPMI|nr:hypothetical protein FA13DRAFT_1688564 [Coprinellus micaceus]
MAFTQAHGFKFDTLNIDHHEHSHSHTHMHHPTPTLALPLDPMQLLRDARAIEATHTSTTAAYAPKCRPGSRTKVIQDVMDWITTSTVRMSPSGSQTSILWFHGPAGGGKTCIMREKMGLLTASYFFSTGAAGLDNETSFVATIAWQSVKSGTMRAEMSQAILENPDLLKESPV